MANLRLNTKPRHYLKRSVDPTGVESAGMYEENNGDIFVNNPITFNNTVNILDGIISISYDDLYDLYEAGELMPGTTYYINDSDIRIFIKAVTTTGFDPHAVLKTANIDHQNNTGNFLGIWHSSLAGVAANKLCAWNNFHYRNLTGSNGASNPSIDTTNWVLISNLADSSYQVEYDPIIYDFDYDTITARWDRRGNFVQSFDQSAINKFQWGNDSVYSNFIYTLSSFDIRNARTAPNYMTVIRSAMTITDTARCRACMITGGSSIILSGSANADFLKAHESNLTMTGGTCLDTILDTYATINVSDTANCGLNYFRNCSLTFSGTSVVTGCLVDGGNALNTGFTKTFASENHANKTYRRNIYSNFVNPTTESITSAATTLALDGELFYGIYPVTVTGGTASIDTITGLNTNIPSTRITLTGSNSITFVHGATLKLKGAVNKTCNPSNNDWIEFGLYNGAVNQEINSGIY